MKNSKPLIIGGLFILSLLVVLVAFSGVVSATATLTVGPGEAYSTIQSAINDATSGDTINIDAGTYAETLDFKGKSLDLEGAGIGSTIIDAHSFTGYAIQNFGASSTIRGLTLIGTGSSSSSYGFKISHINNIILENIKVENSYKTGIDLNTVNGATLNNIEVDNTVNGFGLMILDSSDITVNGITTNGNAWGGVSVQTKNAVTNNVNFEGNFNVVENTPLLLEKDPTGYYDITNVNIPSKFQYVVYDFRAPENYKQWYYFETLDAAKTFAQTIAASTAYTYSGILIYDIAKNNYYVEPKMKIQDAINDATSGDTINIDAGTYDEQIVITKSLTLQGAGDTTVIKPSSVTKLTTLYTLPTQSGALWNGAKLTSIISVSNTNNVTIKDLKVDGESITSLPAGADYVSGISYGESSGVTDSVSVLNMNAVQPSSVRTYGMWFDSVNNPAVVEVKNSDIVYYNKNGITARGGDLFVNIHDNNQSIIGSGTVPGQVLNGIVLVSGANGTISNNKVYGNHYEGATWLSTGIMGYDAKNGVIINNNEIYNTDMGIASSSYSSIYNNYIHNCLWGIELESGSAYNSITGNLITNNEYGIQLLGPGSPYYTGSGDEPGLNNFAHYNTLTNNTFGVKNWDPTQTFDATNNYWGSNNPNFGSLVSGNVNYTSWITQSSNSVETTPETPILVNTTGTNASVTLTTSTVQTGTITVQQSSSDSHGGFSAPAALGKFISINSTIPEDQISNVEIRIYYTDAELLASHIDETTLKMYYWNPDTSSWEVIANSGVNTTGNYVWAITNHFSDYGTGGETDVTGPTISIPPTLSTPFPNPKNASEFTIYVYANITDPSGVANYPSLRWRIIGSPTIYYETTMNPSGDSSYYGGITAPKIDGLGIEYRIAAKDNLGNNNAEPGGYETLFYYDGTAPVTTLTIGDPKYGTSPLYIAPITAITLSCNDGVTGNGCNETDYQINDGSLTTYSTPFTISGVDGEYALHYYSIDKSGNIESINNKTVILDNTIPTITNDYTNSGVWVNTTQTITLIPSDGTGSGISAVKTCEGTGCDTSTGNVLDSPYQLSYTTSQDTIVRYQTWDNLGNPSDIGSFNVKIDTESPTITNDYVNDGVWVSTDQIVTLTPEDTGGSGISQILYCEGVDCNPSTGSALDSPYELSFTETMDKVIRYQAIDAAGNPSGIGEFHVMIDKGIPATTDDYVAKDNLWQNSTQTITLTPQCGESGCQWTKYCTDTTNTCDPAVGNDYTTPISISAEGTTYFRYASENNAGNIQPTVTRTIKIDTTSPTITNDYTGVGWVGTDQTVTLTPSDDSGSGIQEVKYCTGTGCDTSTGNVLDSPYQLSYTTSQDTIVRYQTIDNAGNPSAVGEFHIMLDKEDPTITDNYSNDGVWVNTAQTVKLTANDGTGSGISAVKTCEGTDCTPSTTLSSPYQLTYPTDQDTVVRYQAFDVMGNPSDIGSFNVKIDTVKPDVDDSNPSGTLNTSNVQLSLTTNEPTICKYDLSSKSFSKMANTLGSGSLGTTHTTSLSLADGSYNYHVRCQDKAGNDLLATEALLSFTVNTKANFGYTADLTPTWSTFTLPEFVLNDLGYTTTASRSPSNILASLDGNYQEIWYYNGTSWLVYSPTAPSFVNTLTEFNDVAGNPYWIKMTNSDRLELIKLS